jgi:superfamily II DNA or RNA helicase
VSKLVFAKDFKRHADKCLHFTATPRDAKPIRMLPHKDGTPGDAGRILYHYSLYKAVEDEVCKYFNVLVMFHSGRSDETNSDGGWDESDRYNTTSRARSAASRTWDEQEGENDEGTSSGDSGGADDLSAEAVLRVLARSIARTRGNRVLTFHNRAKAGASSVRAFATPQNQRRLQQLLREFGASWVKRVRLEGLIAEDSRRQEVLQQFDATPEGEVFVLASCRTIGEGVANKNANMVMFVQPRGSYSATIQVRLLAASNIWHLYLLKGSVFVLE